MEVSTVRLVVHNRGVQDQQTANHCKSAYFGDSGTSTMQITGCV